MLFFSLPQKYLQKSGRMREWGCKKKKKIVKEFSTLSLLCKPTEIWLAWAIQPPVRRALSKHRHLFYAQCPTKHTHKALRNKCTCVLVHKGKKDVSKYIWALMVMITVTIANPNNWCLIRNVDSVSPLPGEKHLHTCHTHAFMSFFIYHYLLREERCQNILGF